MEDDERRALPDENLTARPGADRDLRETREALERNAGELLSSLALTRATLEATADALLVVDQTGRVVDFNRKLLDLWRITPSDLTATTHRDVVVASSAQLIDPDPYLARLDAIYAAPRDESFDVLDLADGRVYERVSMPHVVGQRVVGRVWSFRDVTAARSAEEADKDERRVLELGTAIASMLDMDVLVQHVTDACTAMCAAKFGVFFHAQADAEGDVFRLEGLSGAPRESFDSVGDPRAAALFGPVVEGQPAIRIADVLLSPGYGSMGPFHGMPAGLPVRSYLAVPVVSRAGSIIGGLFFGHPEVEVFTARRERLVTGVAAQIAVAMDNARLYEDVKRAADERARLLEAERAARTDAERMSLMKDEFLATLSHELRTPLNAVLGWSELLATMQHTDPQIARSIDAIVRNARAQAQLIDDLLD